ncbi:MAG: hypothetical protein EOO38_30500, partial [Cytophagaceae bacterium]
MCINAKERDVMKTTYSYNHLLTLLPDDRHTSMLVQTHAGQLPAEMTRDGQQLYVAHYVDHGAGPQKTWRPVSRANFLSDGLAPQNQAHHALALSSANATSNTSPPALNMSEQWPHSVENLPTRSDSATASPGAYGRDLLRKQPPLDLPQSPTADSGLNSIPEYAQHVPPSDLQHEHFAPPPRLDMSLLWPSHSTAMSQTYDVPWDDNILAHPDMPLPESLIDMAILWPITDDKLTTGHNVDVAPMNPPATTTPAPLT